MAISAEHRYGAGNNSVSYKLTEDSGRAHYVPSKTIGPGFDMPTDMEIRRLRKEVELAEADILNIALQIDDNINPKYVTKAEAKKQALLYVFSIDNAVDVLPYLSSISFLQTISDANLKTLLDIGNGPLAKIRAWQVEMQAFNQTVKNYEALI